MIRITHPETPPPPCLPHFTFVMPWVKYPQGGLMGLDYMLRFLA